MSLEVGTRPSQGTRSQGSAGFGRDLLRHPPAEHSSGFWAFAAVWAVRIALSASPMAGLL